MLRDICNKTFLLPSILPFLFPQSKLLSNLEIYIILMHSRPLHLTSIYLLGVIFFVRSQRRKPSLYGYLFPLATNLMHVHFLLCLVGFWHIPSEKVNYSRQLYHNWPFIYYRSHGHSIDILLRTLSKKWTTYIYVFIVYIPTASHNIQFHTLCFYANVSTHGRLIIMELLIGTFSLIYYTVIIIVELVYLCSLIVAL